MSLQGKLILVAQLFNTDKGVITMSVLQYLTHEIVVLLEISLFKPGTI